MKNYVTKYQYPISISISERGKPEPIRLWQQRFERYLFLTGRTGTCRRYARVLDKFLRKYPNKKYPYEFLRPLIDDYVQTRFAEGASVNTVRLELSAIRSFWKFMVDLEAFGVFFVIASGVRAVHAKPSAQRLCPDLPKMQDGSPRLPENSFASPREAYLQ